MSKNNTTNANTNTQTQKSLEEYKATAQAARAEYQAKLRATSTGELGKRVAGSLLPKNKTVLTAEVALVAGGGAVAALLSAADGGVSMLGALITGATKMAIGCAVVNAVKNDEGEIKELWRRSFNKEVEPKENEESKKLAEEIGQKAELLEKLRKENEQAEEAGKAIGVEVMNDMNKQVDAVLLASQQTSAEVQELLNKKQD